MSINLHDSCKNRLKEGLSLALTSAKLNYLSFINRESLYDIFGLESVLPTTGNTKEELETYISESPLFDFVYGFLSKKIIEEEQYSSDHQEEALTYLDGYQDLAVVADNLIEEFDSLPWQYAFTFSLDSSIAEYVSQEITQIAPDIRLLKAGDELFQNFQLNSGIPGRDRYLHGGGLLGLSGLAEWKEDFLYIQIRASGFVGKFVNTTPVLRAIDTFKSFLGLMIALRALEVRYSYSSSTIKNRAYVHRKAGKWMIEDSFELDYDVSKTISDLKLDNLGGSLDTDEHKRRFIANRFGLLSKALARDEDQKLRLAGRWLFDSYCGSNELLSFIQTTVSLEILLGEKASSDLMGLGELLRNRCAYLIGNTHVQRQEILDDFKQIYDIRSKIVHRGKSQLKRHERVLFHKLQWMANRVIQEEIELIGKNA